MSSSGKNSISLRVKDALKRDAGRGIARLDTRNMEKLVLRQCPDMKRIERLL